MRTFWNRVPTLRILFAFIAGIGLAMLVNDGGLKVLWLWVFSGLLLISIIPAIILNHLKNIPLAYKLKALNGLAVTVAIITLGYLLTAFHIEPNYKGYFGRYLASQNRLIVQLDEPPVTGDKIVRSGAKVLEIDSVNKILHTSGRIELSFAKDSLSEGLQYGDVIFINSKIDSIDPPMNPAEFSFKRYYSFQNICYKTYLNRENWKLLKSGEGNALITVIFHVRDNFLSVIKKYVPDKNDFGVASALMLGYSDYINRDIKRAYISSGTYHVLSVSGLHVAIIFIMLNFLLQWMNARGRKAEIAKALIIITFIWFYAILTGMSPPVLRSAIMFSLLQLGRVLIRNANTYNVIAGSAILLLLFNPFLLADIGFQLSYIAVTGIVYLQPKIYALLPIDIPELNSTKVPGRIHKIIAFFRYDWKWMWRWLLDACWQLTAVSIAAEIAALPLSLLYFYQFPNLFIISNLVVIPLSNLVLFTGTALFVVAHIPYLNDITGWIFNHLLMVLDKYIFWTDKMPLALTRGLSITVAEMVLLYVFIILLCWLSEERRPRVLVASLAVFLSLCSFHSYHAIKNHERRQIVVYDVPKEEAIAFITGNKVLYDIDNELWNNSNAMALYIWHHWANCGLTEELPLENQRQYTWKLDFGKIVLFEGRKILIVNSAINDSQAKPPMPLQVDLLIISGSPKIHINQLKNLFDFKRLVFDSSNKPYSIRRWESECDGEGINYWDVRVKGAYIQDI